MPTPSQHRRIARACANSIVAAIESLPRLLQQTDAEIAAAIVADLVKACICTAEPEGDPGAELAAVIRMYPA